MDFASRSEPWKHVNGRALAEIQELFEEGVFSEGEKQRLERVAKNGGSVEADLAGWKGERDQAAPQRRLADSREDVDSSW